MDRLDELYSYHILETPREKDFDDLAVLAAAICDTPVSLISFIDDKRQWYKSKVGIEATEVPIAETFCQYTLDKPNENLVVLDPASDERFQNNPNVVTENGIAFYAGVPLVSVNGNVLGTVCVIDYKKRTLTKTQLEALKIISQKAMEYLERRKFMILQQHTIERNLLSMKRLMDMVPGYLFKLVKPIKGNVHFAYVSGGIERQTKVLTIEMLNEQPTAYLKHVHPDDRIGFIRMLRQAFEYECSMDYEFRLAAEPEVWHGLRANCKPLVNGDLAWYGIVQNVSQKKAHEKVLKKVLFDISHIIRRPVANFNGLIDLMEMGQDTHSEMSKMIELLKQSADELNESLSVLNADYDLLRIQLAQQPGT